MARPALRKLRAPSPFKVNLGMLSLKGSYAIEDVLTLERGSSSTIMAYSRI